MLGKGTIFIDDSGRNFAQGEYEWSFFSLPVTEFLIGSIDFGEPRPGEPFADELSLRSRLKTIA
jgi:hypothetical protein